MDQNDDENPVDGEGIKAEMRLWTLEVLVADLFAIWCVANPNAVLAFRTFAKGFIEGSDAPIPGVSDPALSDLYSAERLSAATRLMDMAKFQLKSGLGPQLSAGIDDPL